MSLVNDFEVWIIMGKGHASSMLVRVQYGVVKDAPVEVGNWIGKSWEWVKGKCDAYHWSYQKCSLNDWIDGGVVCQGS